MATFTNQAQLSYNNSTASSNVAVGELVSVLSAEKTVLNPDYTNGDTITYIVNLVNTGDTAIQDLHFLIISEHIRWGSRLLRYTQLSFAQIQ